MLMTLKEKTGWVQRRTADGLYAAEDENGEFMWGPVEAAVVWKYHIASNETVEMVPITIKTYYIVNTKGSSYVPPV